MSSRTKMAVNWTIVVLIALAVTVLPGGGPTLNIVLSLISIAFFVGIAMAIYRFYRDQHFLFDSLSDKQRTVLYASIGLALLDLTATSRLFNSGGLGLLIWIAILGACSYGVMWVFVSYRRYN